MQINELVTRLRIANDANAGYHVSAGEMSALLDAAQNSAQAYEIAARIADGAANCSDENRNVLARKIARDIRALADVHS